MVVEFNRIFAIESKRSFFRDLSLKGRDDRLFDLRGGDPGYPAAHEKEPHEKMEEWFHILKPAHGEARGAELARVIVYGN